MSEFLDFGVGWAAPRIATQRPITETAFQMDHKDEKAASGDDLSTASTPDAQDQPVTNVEVPASAESGTVEQAARDIARDSPIEPTTSPSDLTVDRPADQPVIDVVPAVDTADRQPVPEDDIAEHGPDLDQPVDASPAAEDDDGDATAPEQLESNPAVENETRSAPSLVLAPARRSQPFPLLTWHYSAILPVAVLALLATLFFAPTTGEPESIAFRILEDGTGAPLAGIEISVNEKVMTSDAAGIVHVDKTDGAIPYRVEGDGFPAATGNLDPQGSARQQISIPRLASASTGSRAVAPASNGPSGQVDARQVATPPIEQPASSTPRAGKVRQPGTGDIEGTVLSATGDPLRGARITDGKTLVITGKDGLFTMDRAKLAANASLTITASGYADQTVAAADVSAPLEIALETQPVNAIYMNPNISTTEADVDRLIEIIDTTDANAIVIDIKEELIFYDSKVEFFVDAGTVRPIIDLRALLKKFRDHDIYTIARLVVFKDSLVAENQPDLAVLNNQTGDLWRDMNGVSWVNPMEPVLWEANSDLAVEAAELGFDEIQYDYVRFPTDGDLSTTDFGMENTQENRENAIHGLLKMTREKLLPTGAKLSADVFGYTLLVDDDLGIGQNFIKMAEYVDYLSPMVYPSHFPNGSIDVDGHPNDFPYETIEVSMRKGREKLDGTAAQIRPWLQDFSFFDLMPYGDDEVRAQIDASEDVGTSGWMLWDPNNEYHPGALDPDDAPAKPAAVPPTHGQSVSRGRRPRLHPRPSASGLRTPC